MKKFEITFEGKNYDYVTRNMIDEYMRSIIYKGRSQSEDLKVY